MATFVQGDWFRWYARDNVDLALFTTNSVVTRDGRLVMGAGLARQVRDRWPGIDRAIGSQVREMGRDYHLLISPRWPQARVGAFQVKWDWHDQSDLGLIAKATLRLQVFVTTTLAERGRDRLVILNFPGVGNGRLSVADVKPFLDVLPDQVIVLSEFPV